MRKGLLKYLTLSALAIIVAGCQSSVSEKWSMKTPDAAPARTVLLDTMNMRNPFIYLDKEELTYYMTGDGGHVWTSKNLQEWCGPYNVLKIDTTVWYGKSAQITAPEIHKFNDKYYYVATFTRDDSQKNVPNSPVRSCEILVSDSICGPFVPTNDSLPLMNIEYSTQSPTFITDEYGWGYIIYSRNNYDGANAATQIIMLTKDLAEQIGDPFTMFKASQNSWSSNSTNAHGSCSPMLDGPFLFDTEGRELGILFISQKEGATAVGVAYTEKNHGLNGPWHIEPEPLLVGGYGQPMLFNDFDGSLVMLLHKDTIMAGSKKSIPRLIEMDSQYDKLKIKSKYNI